MDVDCTNGHVVFQSNFGWCTRISLEQVPQPETSSQCAKWVHADGVFVGEHMSGNWCVVSPTGLTITVRLTPGSSRTGFDGLACGAEGRWYLKARVTCVPEKGKANKALIALIAKKCQVGKTSVRLLERVIF